MDKVNLFIVGAPKSGTTALAFYLDKHPDIHFLRGKEPLYFGSDLIHYWKSHTEKSYQRLIDESHGQAIIGEGSVWYLYSRKASIEIREYNPKSKIIIMLRNPVDAMYSLHGQFLYTCNESIISFEKALDMESSRASGKSIPPYAHFPAGLLYRQVYNYVPQVKRYLDSFGENNVHIVIYDDFKKHADACYKNILKFINVDPGYEVSPCIMNKNKKIRSPLLQRLLLKPPVKIRDIGKKALGETADDILGWRLYKIRDKLLSLNSKVGEREPIATKTRIKELVRKTSEIDTLSHLIGRDLSHWYQI
ncbi:sulfotransferase [Pseudomonadota bacterium]